MTTDDTPWTETSFMKEHLARPKAITPSYDTYLRKTDDSSPEDQWWQASDAWYWEDSPVGSLFQITMIADTPRTCGVPAVYLYGPTGTFLMPLHWITEDHFQVVDRSGRPIVKQTRYVYPGN